MAFEAFRVEVFAFLFQSGKRMGMAAFFPDFRCFGVTGRADCFPDEWRILALAFHAVEVGEEQFLDFLIVLLEKILQNRIIVKITAEPGDPQVFRNFQLPLASSFPELKLPATIP